MVGLIDFKTHLNTLLKFEVIWAKEKPELTEGNSERESYSPTNHATNFWKVFTGALFFPILLWRRKEVLINRSLDKQEIR